MSARSPHMRVLPVALFFSAALGSLAGQAGTLNYGTFVGTKVTYANVSESGETIPPGLFVPATPVLTDNPDAQLTFGPQEFVQTDQNVLFDLKTKSSQLNMDISGNSLPGNPDYLGYALAGISFNIAGTYSVWAPFGVGDLAPTFLGASIAKVTMSGDYSVQVTGVDWAPYSGGAPILGSMVVTPSDMTVTGPQNAATTGTWQGSTVLDWAALRSTAGLSPSANITQIAFQYTAVIGAASVYGAAETRVTNFNVIDPAVAVPVPVPEPPTIILAGLGAVAVVANGYRRRKQRSQDSNEGQDAGDLNGAIALTA
jgi:hypothetical protein